MQNKTTYNRSFIVKFFLRPYAYRNFNAPNLPFIKLTPLDVTFFLFLYVSIY